MEELPPKWKELYTSLSIVDKAENLFHQTVNVVLYEQLLKEHFAVERPPKSSTEIQLSKDELNALRYVSGYVPMKSTKKRGTREEKRWGRRLTSLKCAWATWLSPARKLILHNTQVNGFIKSIKEVCFPLMMRH